MKHKVKVYRRRRAQRKARPLSKAQQAALVRRALRAHYDVECYYTGGLDVSLDRQLETLARRRSAGSGMWLHAGLRDIEFAFVTERAALAAAARIKSARLPGVRVMLRSYRRA